MRSDVHAAALRAAAKVAFSVAFIGGCSAAAPDAADEGDPAAKPDGVQPGTTESNLGAKKSKPKVGSPATTACRPNDSGAPKPSCESVVAAAFPTEGNYPGTKQSVSHEVQTCCAELLGKSQGALASHRWDCCANLASADASQLLASACTPWGPPVPPSMKGRAKRVSPPDAWVVLGEVA